MFDDDILSQVRATLEAARAAGAMIVTAESCTGGLVAASLTAVPGASDAVDGGFITYSNAAKERLGVDPALIIAHGAVSEAVARALAEAARARATGGDGGDEGGRDGAVVAVSVTGVAGPGGGTADKPVGLVHFAAADRRGTIHRAMRFDADSRDTIRRQSILVALNLVVERCGGATR